MNLRIASLLGLYLLPIFMAAGGTITLSAVDSGWYQSDGSASASTNQNYIAGTIGGSSLEFRDFFVFDLSSVTQPIISAQLQAYNPSITVAGDIANGFTSPNASDTFNLFDVSTPITTLSGRTGGVAAFTDLGGGTTYGTHVFTTADNGTIVSISLNAMGIAALNGAHTLFALGGADVTVVLGQARDNVFAFTGGPDVSNTTRQLVLQTAAVPEPSTLRLTAICGAILFLLWRRRTHTMGS
ncbi:MAG TPA: PEP-CTERM sorting domain-containing protein [Bryobacteraceae bacterium]|jgi:hypothetical protein|nr:PEP-CTERM sorting domain-containing protein [Bryobacteraceae bacterium]